MRLEIDGVFAHYNKIYQIEIGWLSKVPVLTRKHGQKCCDGHQRLTGNDG